MASFALYGESLWISPYVFSSFVALREKGTPFDVIEVALAEGKTREPDYHRPSVTGRVPSLEHAGFRLAESSAIAEYLDEVLPAPAFARLLPEGLRERARARQIMAWLRSDLIALRDERPTVTMFYPFRPKPLSPQARSDADRLLRVTEQLIPGEGPLFGAWCLADSELAFMLHRLILNGEPVPERAAVYARAQWKRPSVREFVEHARPAAIPDTYWDFGGTPRPEPA